MSITLSGVLTLSSISRIVIYERKILRMIYGPIQENIKGFVSSLDHRMS